MCGIVGYIGNKSARNFIFKGLKRLEYRSYDSAGYAVLANGNIEVIKGSVRVSELQKFDCKNTEAHIGIGHIRGATHGKPVSENAHPHLSYDKRIAVVHNGIIENYVDLKKELINCGIVLKSNTDSEIIAHLISYNFKDNLLEAIRNVAERLKGSFSMLVMASGHENELYAYRKNSPLIIGIGNGENYIASDAVALIPFTDKGIVLEDDDLLCLTADSYSITCFKRPKSTKTIKIDKRFIEDTPVKTYMQKEINEIPFSAERTAKFMFSPEGVDGLPDDIIKNADSVYIAGSGTSYHSGLYGKYVIEKLAKLPAEVVISSEMRENTLFFSPKKLAVFISRSGETPETISSLKLAKSMGSFTIALTNIRNSSITKYADFTLYLDSGPELALSATKTYNSLLVAFYILAIKLAVAKGNMTKQYSSYLLNDLDILYYDLRKAVCDDSVRRYAEMVLNNRNTIVSGRGLDYVTAMESALKFKEITYINIATFPAGEFNNVQVLDKKFQIIYVLTNKNNLQKTIKFCAKLQSQGCEILMISTVRDAEGNKTVYIPTTCNEMLMPIVSIVPLQKLALSVSTEQGINVDNPFLN